MFQNYLLDIIHSWVKLSRVRWFLFSVSHQYNQNLFDKHITSVGSQNQCKVVTRTNRSNNITNILFILYDIIFLMNTLKNSIMIFAKIRFSFINLSYLCIKWIMEKILFVIFSSLQKTTRLTRAAINQI